MERLLMAAFFELDLDTIGPALTVSTPMQAVTYSPQPVIVQANEVLAEWRETWAVDARGGRHDFVLTLDGEHLSGEIDMRGWPDGQVTIHAMVRDLVDNAAEAVTTTILEGWITSIVRHVVVTFCAARSAVANIVLRARAAGASSPIPQIVPRVMPHPSPSATIAPVPSPTAEVDQQ
jgi:hypothetical protein